MKDPQAAAKKSGAKDGIALLLDKEVRQEISRLKRMFRKENTAELTKLGLCRIIFSQPQQDEEGKVTEDGFALEKCGGKQADYKFWDKIKACELLLELAKLEQSQNRSNFSGVLGALQKGAAALEDEKVKEEGDEEHHPQV